VVVELDPVAPDEDEPPAKPAVVPVLAPGVPPASAVVVELDPLAPDEDEPPAEPAVVPEPEPPGVPPASAVVVDFEKEAALWLTP
jgi:hypothetical protein